MGKKKVNSKEIVQNVEMLMTNIIVWIILSYV